MKTLGFLVMGLLLVLALPACNTAEKYAANNTAAKQWLDANTGEASIDVSGHWQVNEWGEALLKQAGGRITGTLGEYTANGVLNGRTAYLALSSEGWVFYTVTLRKTSNSLVEGFYSSEVPFTSKDERPISLKRVPQ